MSFAFRSLALGACVALAIPASAREFRSADIHPADYPTVEAVKFMGEQLAAQSGPIWLLMTGPEGTREVLDAELSLARACGCC